jgi:hypothetical protein
MMRSLSKSKPFSLLVLLACLATASLAADAYTKSITVDKSADQVFAAADRVLNKHREFSILERNEQRHVLRFLWGAMGGGTMGEHISADYAVMVVETSADGAKTTVRLTVGRVDAAAASSPRGYPDRTFSKRFFRMLRDELQHS